MSIRFRKELYLTSSLACLAAFAIPGAAFAQAASPANKGIEEIVVTANKRQESINKVGMAIKALSAKTLEQEHVTSLADLAKAVPGLTFTQSEYGTPVYTLRGIGFYDTSLASYPDVSVYLDQAPLPFPVQTELTLFDIQRVEVLEGPQGTLFGNNATGGAINYIANKPTDHFDAGADISYGNYNTLQADGFVSGPLTPKLLGRFAFSTTEADGWQHSDATAVPGFVAPANNSTSPNTQAGAVNGSQDKAAVRAIFDWTPTDDLHVEWNVNGWHDGSQPQQPQLIRLQPVSGPQSGQPAFLSSQATPAFLAYSLLAHEPTVSGADASVADWPGGIWAPRADNSLYQSTLRVDYDLTDTIKLTSITDYVNYQRNERDEGGGSQWLSSDVAQEKGYANSFSQELRAASQGNEPYRWIGGVNYAYDNVYERDSENFSQSTLAHNFGNWPDSLPVLAGLNTVGGLPTAGSAFDSRQDMSNYAVFANGEYDIFRQFTVKGGIRFTQSNRSDNSCSTYFRSAGDPGFPSEINTFLFEAFQGAVPTNGQCFTISSTTGLPVARYQNKLDQSNTSWHGGLDWKPTSDILAYANVSKGFKAGGFPTIPGTTTSSQGPVTQEDVVDYEVGTKAQLFDHHLSANASAFYYDYKNKQLKGRLSDPIFGVLDALVNIPKSTVEGAELDVHARPITGLDIGAQATYLEAQITDFTGYNAAGFSQNYDHSDVPYTSKWNLSGNINYERPINDHLVGFAGAQLNYRSSETAAIGSPLYYGMPAYTTLDLQAGVSTADDKWRVFLWGKNVTNAFYVTNVIQEGDAITRYTGMPGTYGVTVSYRY